MMAKKMLDEKELKTLKKEEVADAVGETKAISAYGDKKKNRQIFWIGLVMVAVLLAVVVCPILWQRYANSFGVAGLDFQKTMLGKIMFFSTRVPIADKMGQITGDYAMNFRTDPRILERIEVNLSKGVVMFRQNKPVFISLNPDMERCSDNTIAFVNLAGFLRDFAGLQVKSAVSAKNYSEENNILFADCNSAPNNTVIFVTSGNATQIVQSAENCYELIYSKCEVLDVSERFMLKVLESYMSFFKK